MKNKTMNEQKLISVIMPVYNAGDFLVEAIQSIRSQTYKNWELIAIDDGSTDNSLKILKQFAKKDKRIKIFHFSKNKGIAAALNKGLDKAKGYYIARMDADDISLPRRFETQVKYLQDHQDVIAVGSQIKLINEQGKNIGYKTFPDDHQRLYEMMMTIMAIQHPTLLTYTNFIKKCRYENHTTAEDVSMFFQLLQYGHFGNVPQTLFKYRIRKNSNSLKNPKKTFYLTLKSRIKAVLEWGYKPTIKGIIINIVQWFIITLLPNSTILTLYKLLRFKHRATKKFWRKTLLPNLSFLRNKLAIQVK